MKGSLTDLFANLGDDSRATKTITRQNEEDLDCKPVDLMNFESILVDLCICLP